MLCYLLQLPPRTPVTKYSYIGFSDPSQLKLSSPRTSTLHQNSPTAVSSDTIEFYVGRMWACTKCNFSFNPMSSQSCEICYQIRSPPSLSEPSVITVTKDSVRYTPPKQDPAFTNTSVLEQDLQDDFQFLSADLPQQDTTEQDWTCKKCTLLNSGISMACVVCGGSKLRSITKVCLCPFFVHCLHLVLLNIVRIL
jgi:calpain-15